jgi:hypothetical protein
VNAEQGLVLVIDSEQLAGHLFGRTRERNAA